MLADLVVDAHSEPLSSDSSTSVSLPYVMGDPLAFFLLVPQDLDHPALSLLSCADPPEPFLLLVDFTDPSLDRAIAEDPFIKYSSPKST